MERAVTSSEPTDIFLSNKNFDFLEEYYPWPVHVRDTFTTIQKEKGCVAKHAYNKEFKIDTSWNDQINFGQDF